MNIPGRIKYALEASRQKGLESADRCVLCGWAIVHIRAKGGSCGHTPGEKEAETFGIDIKYSGQHLWLSDLIKYFEFEEDYKEGYYCGSFDE